ncbi:c-type cytochrome [Ferruginibacter paludis]|uniref:c-type cytochrome n=1 Tax=Ferruginibacter paludis TaxID=1310417 RepID=UPI0025B2BE4F|nr:c-type cytochrome [Ferruginibacter paludis]MDN3656899.1 c-type cytochrome [Ferruginibacter paludis]
MRNTFLIFIFASIIVAGAIISCTNSSSADLPDKAAVDTTKRIARGEYLVNVAGCDDCHSPKRMGAHGPEIIPELRFSGYPSARPIQRPDGNVIKQGWALMGPDLTSAAGPWGVSFTANISSDQTGIGAWKEEQFITALRKGKYKGLESSRDLLPPMPWYYYKNMTDEDLKSVFAFLKSTRPVKNIVPAPMQIAEIK